jgi:hypothetical protein
MIIEMTKDISQLMEVTLLKRLMPELLRILTDLTLKHLFKMIPCLSGVSDLPTTTEVTLRRLDLMVDIQLMQQPKVLVKEMLLAQLKMVLMSKKLFQFPLEISSP